MKWSALLLSTVLLVLAFATRPAGASPYELIPGTGIPVPPDTSLDAELGYMPSEDELMLLYALSQLTWNELPGLLVDVGLHRWWWQANLEVSIHSIPPHLPEGTVYDAFLEFTHLPTGDLLGCYLKTGTDDVVCVDAMPAVSWYPQLLSPEGFLDALFPVMAQYVSGQQVGSSMQWSCFDLRANSPQGAAAGIAGGLGGAGAALGTLAASGAGYAIYNAVGTFVMGAMAANGIATAAGATLAGFMGLTAGLVVVGGAVLIVAAGAAIAAHQAYASGAIGGCPGCGQGLDPRHWDCSVRTAADLCECRPADESGQTANGKGSGDSGASCSDEHGPSPEGPRPNDWTDIELGEFAGCDEWESYEGIDNEACSSCEWFQEPEDIQTPDRSTEDVVHGCDLCTGGDAPSLGEVRCWSISVGAP